MPLFKKSPTTSTESELKQIEVRLQIMRASMSAVKVPLNDLFPTIGENERPKPVIPIDEAEVEPARVLPDAIAERSPVKAVWAWEQRDNP
jgi:hypothetical protein